MKKPSKWLLIATAVLLFLTACGGKPQPPAPSGPFYPIPEKMRAVWVSYLELDRAFAGATVEGAKEYIDQVFERCVQTDINTVFFHVRANSDAYYSSDLFPTAESVSPLLSAGFDPLTYAVDAAHKRGISFHAWFNPYRIGEDKSRAVCEDVFELSGSWYYIPTSQNAQRCILEGVREVVDRYAVDGVQYDDYFYPTGIGEERQGFEPAAGSVSVEKQRQAAVNTLIAGTYSVAHSRDNCVFGVSPAGNIERCVKRQYADLSRWLKYPGYVDYLCPQLYSGFENQALPFETELHDFSSLTRLPGVRLFAGLALYKAGETDTFAGSGSGEWQQGGDILVRQAQAVEGAGYEGVALFRFAFWDTPANEVARQEISALQSYFYTE